MPPEIQPRPAMESIARSALHSASAATLSQVWRIAVTFATHFALRRLIPPGEFGAWTWAEPLFLILAQVRDLGLPGHIVRDKERPYGNFLALEAGWGGLTSVAVFLAAPLLALLYADSQPDVVPILRFLCLFLFVQGLGAVPLTYFEAELEVGKTIPAELARNAVFAALSLALATQGFGVWSLVYGHVAGATIYAAMLWWKAWPRLRLRYMPGATGALIKASWPLALMAMLEQTVLKLDAFVIGLRFPTAVVGTAGLAIYATFFFSRLLADPVGRALYPALVRYRDAPRRAFSAFRVATLMMLTLSVPTAFFLMTNALFVSRFLGGEKWLGAAAYLQVVSLVPLARPLNMFGLELLLTRHQDRLLILYSLLNLISIGGLGLYLTTTSLGAVGMAVAGFFPLGSLVLAWGIQQISGGGLKHLLRDIAELYAVAALLFLPILWLGATQTGARLALAAAAGLLTVAYSAWRFGASFRRFLYPDEG